MIDLNNPQAFLLSLQDKIEELTELAITIGVSDSVTHDLKVRIQTLKDVLKYAQGDSETL